MEPDLHPSPPPTSDSAPLLLITATLQEMRSVLAPFGGKPDLVPLRPEMLQAGTQTIILLVSGVGPVNAAMSLGRTLGSNQGIRGVLNLGIGGSFDCCRAPLLSRMVVHTEIWPEIGVRTAGGMDVRALGRGLGEDQERLIQDRLELNPEESARRLGLDLPDHWVRVSSLTVAGVTGTPGEAERLSGRYAALVENMEGFALAWVCAQEDLPFVEVRCVSNKVGSREKGDWDLQGSLFCLREMSRMLLR